MNSSEQLKLDVISKLKIKKITKKQAQQILGVSERTIMRYLEKYEDRGLLFVKHGNKNKIPINKTPSKLKKKITKLVKEKYYDFNMTHCLEKLEEDHNLIVDREVFRSWCHEIKMVKHGHKKRKSKIRRRRDRMAMPGVMLQMDGSPHKWFGGKDSCLIATIDDANNEVPFAEFFPAEDTISCMTILQRVIEMKGRFDILYTDKAGIFAGPKRAQFSQVKRALKELGTEIIYADSAEAKGRIERLWKTLQDRLIPEMRIRNINSYESANCYLQDQYLPNEYARKYEVIPISSESAYRAVPGGIDLNEVFCLKEYRTIKRDHTLSWNTDLYDLKSPLKYSIYGQKIEIRTYQDLTWKAFFAGKEIKLEKVNLALKRKDKQLPVAELINAKKVRKDGHIEYNHKYYSVGEELMGKSITAKEKMDQVYIYHNGRVVEVHNKIVNSDQLSSTKPDHMGPWESSLKPSSFYRKMARRIGNDVEEFILLILKRGQGFIDTKTIFSIINLEKICKGSRLNNICRVAIDIDSVSYKTVRALLNLQLSDEKKQMMKDHKA